MGFLRLFKPSGRYDDPNYSQSDFVSDTAGASLFFTKSAYLDAIYYLQYFALYFSSNEKET